MSWLSCDRHPAWWQIQRYFAEGNDIVDLISHRLTSDLSEFTTLLYQYASKSSNLPPNLSGSVFRYDLLSF